MNGGDLYIVAVAARTPLGLRAESTAAALRAGLSAVEKHPFMVDAAGEGLLCARDRVLDPAVQGPRRLAVLAQSSLLDLAAKLTAHGTVRRTLPVLIAVPESRGGFRSREVLVLKRELDATKPPGIASLVVELVGTGHTGALRALETAVQRITSGQTDLCVVGGVDSYLDWRALDWLQMRLRIVASGVRGGFHPGEGAALIALANDAGIAALGLRRLARLRAVACALERRRSSSPEGLMGDGLSQAILAATDGLARGRAIVHDIYCDMNGERSRTDDWGFAALRTSTRFRDATAYRMSAGQTGDLGAASGALGCVLAVQAWERGYASGPNALVWGASWRGLRGAALLERGGG
jgi:3-oxoacyl-[acyl-carrier-protein] synthase-1